MNDTSTSRSILKKIAKVSPPEPFSGDGSKLRKFKNQMNLFLRFSTDALTSDIDEVLTVFSYLRGPAYDLIEPHLEDLLENEDNLRNAKTRTRAVMQTTATLIGELERVFAIPDEERRARTAIQTVK